MAPSERDGDQRRRVGPGDDFAPCEICGAQVWTAVYDGPVRDGAFGKLVDRARVARCGGCGVDRLAEEACKSASIYENGAYRELLEQRTDVQSYFADHDILQRFTLEQVWPRSLRGKVVADVGCAGGSLLDHVAGLVDAALAIDPAEIYHDSLRQRGYHVYRYAPEAVGDYAGRVDIALSVQVIEHMENPRAFLADIRPLLKPDGILVLSTPNRNDIVMYLLPDDFSAFFYRTVHRWYFDAESLAACAEKAGYRVVKQSFVHRYGMSNALAWLRDRRPTGRQQLSAIDETADVLWSSYLENKGLSDTLYVILSPA